jgi:hypothetical protein
MPHDMASFRKIASFCMTVVLLIFVGFASSYTLSEAVIANHTSLNLGSVPSDQIEAVKKNIKIYFGHTSHGGQIRVGLERLYAKLGGTYHVEADWNLPSNNNALCIRDRSDTYDPGDFFPTVPQALRDNSSINVVMYMWCGQPGNDWETLLQNYLSQMSSLEQQYPKVVFIYFTGHAQEQDCSGDNRNQFNEALRQFCKANKKALFDFGDIDAWYNGEQNTYASPNWCAHAGQAIPLEHPQYHGDQAGHTTFENCENKGKALWWLLAKINGWNLSSSVHLASFQAVPKERAVYLSWSADSGARAIGYEIERRGPDGTYNKIAYIPSGASTSIYSYFDDHIQIGATYFYRLKQINQDGQAAYSGIIQIKTGDTPQFNLWQNYPNPFNLSTEIGFVLPQEENVRLEVFTLNGKRIKVLADDRRPPGAYRLVWDSRDDAGAAVASGLYLYSLKTGAYSVSHKMILMK